ncbi:MAG: scyllo-inositol 2-dehydrogenase (NAD(+)) [candidate division WS2 bacterium]|nr:scyllo-inositol 2-dehydrogenase (NAD(+)) [Candidatus Psychracetigena formicireducens]
MIKVGVIGVGAMGKQHARVYAGLSDVELAGIADTNKDVVCEVAERYSTEAFVDYKELLKRDLDAVSIVVPTSLHKKVALDTAEAGVNMIIEKSIAHTIENARKIIKSADENDVKLMVGHIERFNPIIPVIQKSIGNNDIISIDITRVGPFPPRIRDVGVVIDLATHDIDLIRYLTKSEFKKIYSITSKNISEVEDIATLSFRMENGALAHITTNWLTPFKIREINIAMNRKFIKGLLIDQKVSEYSKYKEDGSYVVKELSVPFGEPLKLELEAFLNAVKEDKKPPITGEDGLKALEVAIKCLSMND